MDYAESCDLRSIMRNRNIAEYQKPCPGVDAEFFWMGKLVPCGCRINGVIYKNVIAPKMWQFENWNLIENFFTRNYDG